VTESVEKLPIIQVLKNLHQREHTQKQKIKKEHDQQ
jgi:hypothetical protein